MHVAAYFQLDPHGHPRHLTAVVKRLRAVVKRLRAVVKRRDPPSAVHPSTADAEWVVFRRGASAAPADRAHASAGAALGEQLRRWFGAVSGCLMGAGDYRSDLRIRNRFIRNEAHFWTSKFRNELVFGKF